LLVRIPVWLTERFQAHEDVMQGLEMKIYLLITLMGLLLTAVRLSGVPKSRPETLPQ
jgi:hypothetical protein